MSEYYGVSTPSSDFLAHYGVKGMKWGVRKALRSGNDAALRKHYMKASKKLADMSLKANNVVNEQKYQAWRKKARKDAVGGSIGGALGGATGTLLGGAMAGARYGLTPMQTFNLVPQLKTMAGQFAGAGALAGGLGSYAGDRLRAHVYKRRQDPVNRAKMLAKRDAWEKEMNATFKGTPYGKKPMKRFQKDIKRLSNVHNPIEYAANQALRARKQADHVKTISNVKIVPNKSNYKLTNEESRALSAIARGEVQPYRRKRYW